MTDGVCMLRSIALAFSLMPSMAALAATGDIVPWAKVGEATLLAVEQERAARNIPSIVVGIVDRSGLVWSGGAGHADAEGKLPVDARTPYRVGGLTQLLTAELMRSLVARGAVDLDAPVTRYLPAFVPRNPFGGEITLRQLLDHRSGLVREPPKGNYFDAEGATLAEAVTSLNGTSLVAKPGSQYKYSNAGYAVLGRVIESVGGDSFDALMRKAVLETLQMSSTSLHEVAVAHSLVAPLDGERFTAPVFDMAIAPAVGAYSNITDLARLAQALLSRDQKPSGSDTLDRRAVIHHAGAIYGYTSDLTLFPADGLAIITIVAMDDAVPVLSRVRDFAARQVFAAQKKQRKPALLKSESVPTALAHRLEGHYSDGARSVEIRILDQRLFLEAPGLAGELRQRAGRVFVDDMAVYNENIQIDAKAAAISIDGISYRRAERLKPAEPGEEQAGLIGEYGWLHNFIRIYERDGDLYARTAGSSHQKLDRVAKDAYRFPGDGPFAREDIRFMRDERNLAAALSLSGFALPRRDFGAETEARSRASAQFVPELLSAARKMSPPEQPPKLRKPQLVEVNQVEPTTLLNVRYATHDNFMGHPFYDSPRFFLQKPAADALIRAHRKLAKQGFGIALIDGYRPWYVTRMFWDSVPPESRPFVADPAQGSRHNRGCAADISMFDLASGEIVEMAGRYDEPSSRSSPLYLGGSSLQRWRRDLLKQAMEAEGYDVYTNEWWHFDYGEWRQYPVMNFEFGEIRVSG